MKKRYLFLALIAGSATLSQAAEPAKPDTSAAVKEAPPAEESRFKWGGDIRLRYIYLDNIPWNFTKAPEARNGINNFQRYRTRFWAGYQATEEFKLHARLVNEFRTHQNDTHPASGSAWNPIDEIIFDNLYFDWNPAENWDLRVGRQDLIYGTGKLILDGTPKDGSRTIYFDAVKATYSGFENTTVDFLGMYTRAKDPLAMHSEDRDLTGKSSSDYTGVEAGGGIYIKNKSKENCPIETYYLYKAKEQSWTSPATGITHDDHPRHVVGTRIMPKFTDTVDGNLELAYQFGEDISAYMLDAKLNCKLSDKGMKPTAGLGWYHVSGDDPGTPEDEGWNPMWARWPQYSELYVYGFDTEGVGRWSNLSMPYIDLTIHPHEKVKTSLLVGYMLAPEKDGIGGGSERGLLVTLWNHFTLKENLLRKGDKLGGHVLLEAMQPGGYYLDSQQDHMAVFGRVELSYSF